MSVTWWVDTCIQLPKSNKHVSHLKKFLFFEVRRERVLKLDSDLRTRQQAFLSLEPFDKHFVTYFENSSPIYHLTYKSMIHLQGIEFCGVWSQCRRELCEPLKWPKPQKKCQTMCWGSFLGRISTISNGLIGTITLWPTGGIANLSKEKNKIADEIWAASNVSLTKLKFFQLKEW